MPLGFARVLARVAATVAVAAYAVLAVLSGLDRLAAEDPQIPAAARWPYARNAAYNAAMLASSNRQWHTAEALMAGAIRADPVNERTIGGLGQVRLWAGDAAGADAAFRISVQRGWRDPGTHFYWMAQSIAAADFATAALHADAMLRAPIDYEARDQIVNPLLEYNEGRDALALRLRQHPQWTEVFAYGIDHEPPDALHARADVIARAGPGIWSCHDTTFLIERLLNADLADDAKAVHNVACAGQADRNGAALIGDRDFVRFLADGRATALDWAAPETADEAISPIEGHPGVQVTASRGTAMVVLSQSAVLRPGAYRLTWHMPRTDATIARDLRPEIKCSPDMSHTDGGSPVHGSKDTYRTDLRFTGGCQAPTVAFWLVPPTKTVTLDDVTLERVGD